jgi:2-succinyl-6-hydroxy-2,4-cyclohexadiene-1-carboxylate synthase
MGGRVALGFAATYPQRVRRLILESASPGLGSPEEREARVASDSALADRIERGGLPAFVDYWENIPLFASQKRLPQVVQAQVRAGRLAASPLGLANSLRGLSTGRQPSYWEALPTLPASTLLIAGELDNKYAQIAAQMEMFLRRAALQLIPNAGHTVHLEAPDDFSQQVLNFLAK